MASGVGSRMCLAALVASICAVCDAGNETRSSFAVVGNSRKLPASPETGSNCGNEKRKALGNE